MSIHKVKQNRFFAACEDVPLSKSGSDRHYFFFLGLEQIFNPLNFCVG